MAIADLRFPTDIAYRSVGGPEFSTSVVVTHGGHEQRNSNWSQARARYNIAGGVKNQTQLDALIALFRNCRGKAQPFRFKDWCDYRGVNESLGTGNGSLKTFQLRKRYASFGVEQWRTIIRPVSGTVSITVNGVVKSSGVTVDSTTGIVTFTTAPANGALIAADFEFDVLVRFDTDRLSAILASYGSYSTEAVPLVEVHA